MARPLFTSFLLIIATFVVLATALPAQGRGGVRRGARPPRVTTSPQDRGKWIPGHYVTKRVRVRAPATTRKTWIAPVYKRSRDRRGNPIQILLRAGHWKMTRVPATIRTETRKVWVKGYWKKS